MPLRSYHPAVSWVGKVGEDGAGLDPEDAGMAVAVGFGNGTGKIEVFSIR